MPNATRRSGPVPRGSAAARPPPAPREEPLDFAVRETDPLLMLRVRNPLHGTQYLVYLPEYPSRESALCTCPDFARRARGTCKHLEGAVRFLAGRPVEPPRPRAPGRPPVELWEAIDRARAVDAGNPPTLRALRATGALLYEEGEGPTPARTTSGRTK